ncbi:hypothetical protein BG006_005378 [Podila minutissima]|uniref:Heparan-alpha-glucosaminide N-acetyltransferase catalytic domain-containing protein n=1 Tax=Podila minutissima TaxID=64525 RepID=A0A9P5SJY7_9FUNG|nr:hypothetical protein BG006_005378 [Podila minutissima]
MATTENAHGDSTVISTLSPTTLAERKDNPHIDDHPLPLTPETEEQDAPTVAPVRKRFNLPSNRLLSLDLLRGLAIFLMITCNSQNGPEVFDILEHPEWIGFSVADCVFPSFLFISGVAIPLAMRGPSPSEPNYDHMNPGKFFVRQALRVFKRALSIMCLGYVLALYGLVQLQVGGDQFRWPGVLARIGFCYGIVAWMHLLVLYRGRQPEKPLSIAYLLHKKDSKPATPPKKEETKSSNPWPWFAQVTLQYWLPIGCLVIWLIATYSGVKVDDVKCTKESMILEPECSPQAYFDLKIFGTAHTYRHNNFDPEGALSTLTSILNVWFGWFIGCTVREFNAQIKQTRADFKLRRDATLQSEDEEIPLQEQVFEQEMVVRTYTTLLGEWFWWGLLWMFVGLLFSLGLPLSKPSWTATFAVFHSGLSQTVLAILFFKFDGQPQLKKLARLHKDHQGLALGVEPERAVETHQRSTMLNVYYAVDHFFRHWFRWGIKLVLGSMGRNAILLYMCAELVTGTCFIIHAGPRDPETGERPDLWTASFVSTWGKADIGGWGSLFYSLGFVSIWVCVAILLDHKKLYFKV